MSFIGSQKHIGRWGKDFRDIDKNDDPKIITVDLDEDSNSHQGSVDLRSEETLSASKRYKKYTSNGSTFFKDYQSSSNSRTTAKLPKYSEMITTNSQVCSSKFNTALRSWYKRESSVSKNINRTMISPKRYDANRNYFSPARNEETSVQTNFMIAPTNRKIKSNANSCKVYHISNGLGRQSTKRGGRNKMSKKQKTNLTFLNAEALVQSPSGNSYNDGYASNNLHHTAIDIDYKKSSNAIKRNVKDYSAFDLMQTSDYNYSSYDTNEKSVIDLRKAKSTKHNKKPSKISNEIRQMSISNLYTSNGLKLDKLWPSTFEQNELSDSDVKYIEKK